MDRQSTVITSIRTDLNLVETAGVEPTVPKRRIYSPLGIPIFLHLQICNTLRYAFRQRQGLNEECVLKHTDNACYAVLRYGCSRPFQYALIRTNFSSHTRDSILVAARLQLFIVCCRDLVSPTTLRY